MTEEDARYCYRILEEWQVFTSEKLIKAQEKNILKQ